MKDLFRFGLSAFLVSVLFAGCSKSDSSNPVAASDSNPTESANYFKTHFQDESQYIVETVLSDIAEMAFYARSGSLPDASDFKVEALEKPESISGSPVYDCQIRFSKSETPLKFVLPVNRAIWSPEVYAAATKTIFHSLGLASEKISSDKDDVSVLDDLTDGKAPTIEDLSQSLSAALTKDFRNPVLHEKASLILGAFVLRETSGKFYNIRAPLCRMTAHLAFASALSDNAPRSLSGRFAEIMLDTGMGNQKDALAKLETVNPDEKAAVIWKRVLKTINTSDYRPLAEVANATPVERAAWFWSYALSSSVTAAWDRLYKFDLARPDFCRMANSMDYSVSTGHDLLQRSLPLEQKEIEEIYELYHGKKLSGQSYASVLNDPPENCVTRDKNGDAKVRVIGWGQWASFLQRQLCHAVQQNYYFLNNRWGVYDDAKEFAAEWNKKLSGLRLAPFVRRFTASDEASYHKAVDDGFVVTVETPHLVSPECWNYLCYKVSFAPLYSPNPNPHVNEWHKHNPPPGTAYDPSPRMNHPSLISQPDTPARLEKLHNIAPYDLVISWNLRTAKYGTNATYEQLAEIYGPMLDYSATPMVNCAAAAKDQPAKYEPLMLKAAKLQPSRYGNLANYFWHQTNMDKAVYYAEQRVEHDPDSVSVANASGWLIQHYLDVGNTNRARELADFAGDVYSYAGLQAKAEFLERIEKFEDAFDWFKKIEERYNNSTELMQFCIRYRQKTNDRRFEPELDKRLNKIFPKGMKKVSVSDFSAPPRFAVLIDQDNDLLKQANLKKGDVIVAVDGIQVFDLFQYIYVRDKGKTDELKLIVWNGTTYREVNTSLPNRRFEAIFRDYRAK